jgi:hypothetical protein
MTGCVFPSPPSESSVAARPIGDSWAPVTSGSTPTVSWSVLSTAGSSKTICFALEFTPSRNRALVATSPGPGGTGAEVPLPPVPSTLALDLYKGHQAYCVPQRNSMSASNPITILYFPDERIPAQYNIVAGIAFSDVEHLTAKLTSGSDHVVPVDSSGIFVFQYAPSDRLDRLDGIGQAGSFHCQVETAESPDLPSRELPGCSTDDPSQTRH